jgi:photosystem II stability/assembly factor-like uncharacterized protein
MDGIDFWNDTEGIIYGDAIDKRMLLLATHDGGKIWKELPEAQRPILSEGEGSFAASGTGIRYYDQSRLLISTGGKVFATAYYFQSRKIMEDFFTAHYTR